MKNLIVISMLATLSIGCVMSKTNQTDASYHEGEVQRMVKTRTLDTIWFKSASTVKGRNVSNTDATQKVEVEEQSQVGDESLSDVIGRLESIATAISGVPGL